MPEEIKSLKERDNMDLLELTLQLHARSIIFPSEELHKRYAEARKELEHRLNKK